MRRSKLFVILFLLLLFSSLIFSQGELNRANTLYSNGKYEKALNLYLKILKDKRIHNAYLYYNIGNCYFKLGKLPEAILYYERAHLLKPHDDEISFNLKYARSFIKDKFSVKLENPLEILSMKILHIFSINFLSYIFILFFLFLNVSFYLFFKNRKGEKKKKFLYIFITIFVITILSASVLLIRVETFKNYNYGIVMKGNSQVYSGPGKNFTLLFSLNGGTKVKIIERKGNFYHIKAGKGYEGWINSNFVKRIKDF